MKPILSITRQEFPITVPVQNLPEPQQPIKFPLQATITFYWAFVSNMCKSFPILLTWMRGFLAELFPNGKPDH